MIDLKALGETIGDHGRVARILIADSNGSTPREKGVSMLVWKGGALGSIGGGRLEFHAVAHAVDVLTNGSVSDIRRQSLGPALGQCCGGSVTLVTEIWDQALYRKATAAESSAKGGMFVRRIEGSKEVPGRVARWVDALSGDASRSAIMLYDGWLIESTRNYRMPVFVYGAGHVGAALARILAPLPHVEVTVADMRAQFTDGLPDNVLRFSGRRPQEVMASAPGYGAHLIVTHEHELDLELCNLVLRRPFTYAGLIGSETKWTRFRKRLRALGHRESDIVRIDSPIGDPGLGKHPQAIAIGAAARVLKGWRMPLQFESAA